MANYNRTNIIHMTICVTKIKYSVYIIKMFEIIVCFIITLFAWFYVRAC